MPSDRQVAVIQLDNPPVNALSRATRQRIATEVVRAENDDAIGAIVLIGSEAFFSAGADVREFNTPDAAAAPDSESR